MTRNGSVVIIALLLTAAVATLSYGVLRAARFDIARLDAKRNEAMAIDALVHALIAFRGENFADPFFQRTGPIAVIIEKRGAGGTLRLSARAQSPDGFELTVESDWRRRGGRWIIERWVERR